MSLLDRAERKFGRYAIPNVAIVLVVLQSMAYVLLMAAASRNAHDPDWVNPVERLAYVPAKVMAGEVWRPFTFLFIPPGTNPVFAFFGLYFLYLMGTALEGYWGSFRFNIYLLIGWLATLAVGWLHPTAPATNVFWEGSIFLAFAFMYPEFEIRLFFVLPVQVKWIALATWVLYTITFLIGTWSMRLMVLAAVLNFLIFFGRQLYLRARYGVRKGAFKAKKVIEGDKPFHTCAACGITDKTHPKMEFRYCPECDGTPGYCADHIDHHAHRKAGVTAATDG